MKALLLLLLCLDCRCARRAAWRYSSPAATPEIFSDYRNTNFKQEIVGGAGGLNVKIKSRSLSLRNLNHRVGDRRALSGRPGAGSPPRFRRRCASNALSLADYLRNISIFLNNRIAYTEADLPQEAAAVLAQNARAIASALPMSPSRCWPASASPAARSTASILREQDGRVEPVPHRWLEIDLPGERRVFYDPQYQDFSSRYLVTNLGVPFERIERFAGVVVRKSKKILDE